MTFKDRKVRRIILAAALFSLGAFLLIAWAVWDIQRGVPQVRDLSVGVQDVVGEIDRLDEALTASARLAAATGEARWEDRYRELDRALAPALDSLTVLSAVVGRREVGDSIVAVAATLGELEARALDRVREGDLAGAVALLESPAYTESKARYQERKAELLQALGGWVTREQDRVDDRLEAILALAAASFLILLLVWGFSAVLIRRQMLSRHQAEADLRSAEERLRAIVDVAPVAIIRVDRDHVVQYWNPAAERIFGWSAEEVLGQPYPLTAPAQGPQSSELFRRGFAGEMLLGVELRRVRKDGSVAHVRMWNAPVRANDGGVQGLVGVFADVSEQHSLEQRLRQAERLKAIGQLAGGIAHDFNNVMTAVQGHADLLLDMVGPDDPLRNDIAEIRRNSERATDLTRQLLAFSRRQVLQPRVLELGEVVEGIEPMLRRLLGERIQLETVTDPDAGRVEADPTQLEQVIVNLAVNARDAMPGGGRLLIRIDNAELTTEEALSFEYAVEPGAYVRLRVSDTGQGMNEETLRQVFEPFFTTKPSGQGTGLGLATVYGIIKQSGGYIWIDSERGTGTEFEILLPRVSKALIPSPGVRRREAGAGGGECVLVVEDDDAVRTLAVRVLESRGYRVTSAATPGRAISLIEEIDGLDVLLTDMVLPEMGGQELAVRVAERFPTVRLVYMSGYTEDEVLRSNVANGTSVFLPKPFSPAELASTVRDVLDGDG